MKSYSADKIRLPHTGPTAGFYAHDIITSWATISFSRWALLCWDN